MTDVHVASWVQTRSGRAVDLLNATQDQIGLDDIAISLSRIARFNGHTTGDLPWTVAHHSILVCDLLPPDSPPALRLLALLHDAHEAYTGDITSPMKSALAMTVYAFESGLKEIQADLDTEIRRSFGLPVEIPEEWQAAIKLADMQALGLEKRDLMAPEPRPWIELPEAPAHWTSRLFPEAGTAVAQSFIAYCLSLIRQRHGLPA